MAEEKKDEFELEEEKQGKKSSEKVIYILTGLLVLVIFGAIAIFFYAPDITGPKQPEITTTPLPKGTTGLTENQGAKNIVAEGDEHQAIKEPAEKSLKQEEPKAKKEAQTAKAKEVQMQKGIHSNVSQQQHKNVVAQHTQKHTEQKPPKKEAKASPKTEEKKAHKTVSTKQKPTEATKQKHIAQKKVEKKVVKKAEKKETKKVVKKAVPQKHYFIQTGAFGSLVKARKEKQELIKKGFKNVLIVEEKGMYKVLIGRFKTLNEATQFKKKHNIKNGWIRIIKSL